jgi:two-component system, response regulator YesN
MLKVFLVEDEIVVREKIRENFPWEKNGFLLAGEASDGEMALPMIEDLQPDIVITDIKMPFMDGLELSRILKKRMPWVKIIVLSGHDEFSYAQQALSIGVDDYVLKPIGSDDLLELLKKINKKVEEESVHQNNLEDMKAQLSLHTDFMKERFLIDLSTGIFSSSIAVEKAAAYGIDIMARYYCVTLISILFSGNQSSYQESVVIENIINELVLKNSNIWKFRMNAREIGLVFRDNSLEDINENSYRISQSLKSEVEKRTNCELNISIGSARTRISGIYESMNDARIASGFDYIFGSQSIVGIDDAKRVGHGTSVRPDSGAKGIQEFLKTGHLEEVEEAVENTLLRLGKSGGNSIFYAFAFTEIISTISDFVEELGGEAEQVLPGLNRFHDLITVERKKLDSYQVFLDEILRSALRFRESKKDNRYGDLIQKAQGFVQTEYTRSDLALADVASEVNLSPGHFSTIFSQETDQTFIEYLTHVRITKAKELLKNSSLKSSEIAFEVGYNDSHYFFHIFKKKTGQTPGAFKKGV